MGVFSFLRWDTCTAPHRTPRVQLLKCFIMGVGRREIGLGTPLKLKTQEAFVSSYVLLREDVCIRSFNSFRLNSI